jgi:hypothetical protein
MGQRTGRGAGEDSHAPSGQGHGGQDVFDDVGQVLDEPSLVDDVEVRLGASEAVCVTVITAGNVDDGSVREPVLAFLGVELGLKIGGTISKYLPKQRVYDIAYSLSSSGCILYLTVGMSYCELSSDDTQEVALPGTSAPVEVPTTLVLVFLCLLKPVVERALVAV